jgi:hypothetical protein
MAERHRAGADPEKRHEAENLAKEAMEEIQHGNKDEGRFLAEEARELDPSAAENVLRARDQEGTDKPAQTKTSGHAKNAKSGSGSKSSNGAKSGNGSRSSSKIHDSGGHAAELTTDHDKIRAWAEARNGRPSVVKGSRDTEGGGILRIDFDDPEESLEPISWDEFFDIFDDRKLAFLYQERTADGKLSRFFKFVRRDEDGR